MSDPRFISLEGIDKTGKTLLQEILETDCPEATFVTDPTGRAPWGEIFKNGPYLHDAILSSGTEGLLKIEENPEGFDELDGAASKSILDGLNGLEVTISTGRVPEIVQSFLFLSARLHSYNVDIEPALRANEYVFADRFSDSWIAYQSVFREDQFKEETDPLEFFADLHEQLVEAGFLATPDLTILITINRETLENRLKVEPDPTEYEEHIEDLLRVQQQYRELATRHSERIYTIDGNSKSVPEVYEEMKSLLEENGVILK